ncbi:MAG: hypothetical protein WCJ37_10925 [Syntrophus sp. (in: bacteria)]
MGRPKKQIDDVTLLNMRGAGKKLSEISKEMSVSIPTLSRRIAILQHKKGLLTKYRSLQNLQLTGLQARILEVVDSQDLENGPLIDLVRAFHVLKKAEIAIRGKESFKVWGLLDHLQALERQE